MVEIVEFHYTSGTPTMGLTINGLNSEIILFLRVPCVHAHHLQVVLFINSGTVFTEVQYGGHTYPHT